MNWITKKLQGNKKAIMIALLIPPVFTSVVIFLLVFTLGIIGPLSIYFFVYTEHNSQPVNVQIQKVVKGNLTFDSYYFTYNGKTYKIRIEDSDIKAGQHITFRYLTSQDRFIESVSIKDYLWLVLGNLCSLFVYFIIYRKFKRRKSSITEQINLGELK